MWSQNARAPKHCNYCYLKIILNLIFYGWKINSCYYYKMCLACVDRIAGVFMLQRQTTDGKYILREKSIRLKKRIKFFNTKKKHSEKRTRGKFLARSLNPFFRSRGRDANGPFEDPVYFILHAYIYVRRVLDKHTTWL